MGSIFQDVRSAIRSLVQNRGLTAAAVLSLGLGIGANTTIFTWVQAVLLRPIPGAANPDRLLLANMESREGRPRSWSYPNYRDMREAARLFDIIAQDDLAASVAVDGRGERVFAGIVSGNFFQVLGIRAAIGRVLTPGDDVKPGGHPVVVLSHAYWQRRFGGDPSIVGREIAVNNTPVTVVGVAQEGFIGAFLGLQGAAWVPMAMQPQMMGGDRLEARGNGWMQALVRLRPGASREQAQSEIASLMRQLELDFPDVNEGRRVRLVRTWESTYGAPSVLAPILGVLSVVVAFVLLIACANVANLLLSRAVGRRREVAIRLSLGASRWRLLRQLLTEAMVLSLVAGAVGVAMVYWTSGLLMAFVPPVDLPIDLGLRVDAGALGFALVASLLTGLVFGLAPAWQASRPEIVPALKEEAGRGSGGQTGHRLRSGLVIVQMAVCLVLLVGATLFLRSLQAAQFLDPGFEPRNMVTAPSICS